ncbi:hypothetical protein JN757_16805 [Pseudomonas granadensis]|uniref:Phage infection protein n=1 Tax=Pseudomonas granadensis TaxID=1421430 RepID=A0ABX7GCH6_9PSED|nr:hypothetical protein [Pseudomonas granadensis]QRK82214.1 hypothetical protein JN757_16805 [Pseudomonas granadensis]
MKRQALFSIAFSLFALNALAATSAQPLVAEGGSDRLLEQRTAAATQTDPLFSDAVAATETDPLFSDAVAEGGSDRLIERRAV